jgi:ubiquinone/menaquinone biosynthesis C-methylase UbiE
VGCGSTRLRGTGAGLACEGCGRAFPIRDGILDMAGDDPAEVITPFQRLMQAPAVAAVYERAWRPLGYRIASSRAFAAELGTVLRQIERGPNDRILDLACGPGVFTRPLARLASGLVVGVDLSWPMLRRARSAVERDGLRNVVLIRATALRLPFIGCAFTTVNCCGALHLFDRPDAALEEIARVLARGGRFSLQTTIRPSWSAGSAYVLERFIRFGFFEEGALREQLRGHGLKVIASERHRISCTLLAAR